MSVANELTRIKGAKNDLKASINAKTDSEHQITNETIDEYADFVDSITGGGSGIDWSAIGYSEAPEYIQEDYDYAKEIYDNWNPAQTSMESKFVYDDKLVVMPLVDTSNVTTMWSAFQSCTSLQSLPLLNTSKVNTIRAMFQGCSKLKTIPLFDTSNVTTMRSAFSSCSELVNLPQLNTSKVTEMRSMFSGCPKLSDESLDNILKMCIGATLYTSTKTLAYLNVSSSYYSASKIQSLPSYEDFIDAGWTIGY